MNMKDTSSKRRRTGGRAPRDRATPADQPRPQTSPPDHEGNTGAESADPLQSLGDEIRRMRKVKGLTLSDVSRRTGLSIGYLSQVERGISGLSIKALKQVSDALDVQVAHLFHDTGPIVEAEKGIIVRANRRRRLTFSGLGISDDLLSPSLSGKLEMLLSTLAPGATSGDEPYTHKGEEAGLVLSGTFELWVEDRHFVLQQGDSFTFSSRLPHRYRNPGLVDTVVVWVISPPTF